MVVYNLGYEQGSRQLRVGRGLGHWKGGVQERWDPEVKENKDKYRDREEGCETGATKCLQISHLLQEEPKSFIMIESLQ